MEKRFPEAIDKEDVEEVETLDRHASRHDKLANKNKTALARFLGQRKRVFDTGHKLAYLETPKGAIYSPVGQRQHPGDGDRGTDARRESGEPVGAIPERARDSQPFLSSASARGVS